MAYTQLMTAALTGATLRQLAHWRQGGDKGAVLVPEVSDERPIRYSFRDLLALRTCIYLRRERSLQKIRRAINQLRDIGELEHLSAYKLVVVGRSIVVVTDEGAVDLLEQPGNLLVDFDRVLRPFNAPGHTVPDLERPRPRLAVHPGVRGGFPVIQETRVPFDKVAALVDDGVPPEDIAAFYPRVSAAAALEAADFGKYVRRYEQRDEDAVAS